MRSSTTVRAESSLTVGTRMGGRNSSKWESNRKHRRYVLPGERTIHRSPRGGCRKRLRGCEHLITRTGRGTCQGPLLAPAGGTIPAGSRGTNRRGPRTVVHRMQRFISVDSYRAHVLCCPRQSRSPRRREHYGRGRPLGSAARERSSRRPGRARVHPGVAAGCSGESIVGPDPGHHRPAVAVPADATGQDRTAGHGGQPGGGRSGGGWSWAWAEDGGRRGGAESIVGPGPGDDYPAVAVPADAAGQDRMAAPRLAGRRPGPPAYWDAPAPG
jgi:hypothetical protein